MNEEKVSTKYLSDFEDHIYKWAVPFRKGTVKAIGLKEGQEVSYEIHTAGEFAGIQLSVDTTCTTVDLDDAVHVVAQLCDKDGNTISHVEDEVTFKVEGAYTLLGIDNGSTSSAQDCKGHCIVTNNGKGLFMIQGSEAGNLSITAECKGIKSDKAIVKVI